MNFRRLAGLAVFPVLLTLTACGQGGGSAVAAQDRRGTVDDRINRIQNNPNLSPEKKEALIADIRSMSAKDPKAVSR